MSLSRTGWSASLRFRLLALLALVQVLFLVAVLLGLNTFLRDLFERTAATETAELGRVIKSALRQQMMKAPELTVDHTLNDLRDVDGIRKILIVDKNGRVAHATDPKQVGTVLDKHREETCAVCHATAETPQAHTWFARDGGGISVIRHVETIANDGQCRQCHGETARLNGVVVLEKSTDVFRMALATVRQRLLGTGALTLILLIASTLVLTTVLVVRPVRLLVRGAQRLGNGELGTRLPVRGGGELAELTSAFNSMAGDLSRKIDEVRNKSAELSIVHSILEQLSRSIHLTELKSVVLRTFLDVLDADESVLITRIQGSEALEMLALSRGSTRIHTTRLDHDTDVRLPDGSRSVPVECWLNGDLLEPFVDTDSRTTALPILGARCSALLVLRRHRPFSPGEANADMLRVVADHTTIAFDNAQLYTMAVTDPLTKLYTIRLFHEHLDDCLHAWDREQVPFGLVMIDIDRFKAVNDRWGHAAGDSVLKEAGTQMLSCTRVTDNGYRYGGEQFAVLLRGADKNRVRAIAERLRAAIEQMKVPSPTGDTILVTASVGFAACPDNGSEPRTMVSVAEAALYQAKQEGRNRTCGGPSAAPSA